MVTAEQVTAALKKLGPSSPVAIANSLQTETHRVAYRLKVMLGEKAVHAAGTGNSRIYGLPDQKLEGAGTPPQKRSSSKKRKSKRKGSARKTRAESPATPAGDFTTALTADHRLVVIDGAQPAQIFSAGQTEEIATLICTAFKA